MADIAVTPYIKNHAGGWKNSPETTTPIDANALDHIETGLQNLSTQSETAFENVVTALATLTNAVSALGEEDVTIMAAITTINATLTDLETRLAALEGA